MYPAAKMRSHSFLITPWASTAKLRPGPRPRLAPVLTVGLVGHNATRASSSALLAAIGPGRRRHPSGRRAPTDSSASPAAMFPGPRPRANWQQHAPGQPAPRPVPRPAPPRLGPHRRPRRAPSPVSSTTMSAGRDAPGPRRGPCGIRPGPTRRPRRRQCAPGLVARLARDEASRASATERPGPRRRRRALDRDGSSLAPRLDTERLEIDLRSKDTSDK